MMKKIILLTVVGAFLGISAPQFVSASQNTNVQSMLQEIQYTEIQLADLPVAVSKAIGEKYPSAKIEKAFKGTDGSYKVSINNADQKLDLFYNEKGELVK